jgi:hypothetical protein
MGFFLSQELELQLDGELLRLRAEPWGQPFQRMLAKVFQTR